MKRVSQPVLIAGSLLALSCTFAGRDEAATSGDEIIVKFAADQAINETIVRAFDDADAHAALEESVQALSAELGVPLSFSRVTSGREIIVEIPMRQTYEVIAERIRDSDEVERTSLEERTSGNLSNGVDVILVTVDSRKVELSPDADLHALAARLVADRRFPVICDIRADGRLAITPDFERLVEALVNELTSRPDVAYAQPNYRVSHYDRTQ